MTGRLLLFSLPAFLLVAGCAEPPPKVGLHVGNIAPPLHGTATNGSTINLEEFRGKVVVLDFWATWCAPCKAMIPHEKSLVKRMRNRPFVFVGISADHHVSALKDFLEREEISWANIFDGDSGSIATAWEVDRFPSTFVIDARGIIRYTDVREADLELAVNKLVNEAEGK
jgi:peroxiredoxin